MKWIKSSIELPPANDDDFFLKINWRTDVFGQLNVVGNWSSKKKCFVTNMGNFPVESVKWLKEK